MAHGRLTPHAPRCRLESGTDDAMLQGSGARDHSPIRGPVSTEVTLRVAAGVEIVSVITSHSARRLKLKRGGRVHALIKADSVILAVD